MRKRAGRIDVMVGVFVLAFAGAFSFAAHAAEKEEFSYKALFPQFPWAREALGLISRAEQCKIPNTLFANTDELAGKDAAYRTAFVCARFPCSGEEPALPYQDADGDSVREKLQGMRITKPDWKPEEGFK